MLEMQGKVNLVHEEPFKIELTRGQRGGYGWIITVHTVTGEQAVDQLVELDRQLKAKFNNGEQ